MSRSWMLRRPTPHGVGGLKLPDKIYYNRLTGPTPHGVGGLKFIRILAASLVRMSHSPRSGWIEMAGMSLIRYKSESHSPRSGWIEMLSAFNAAFSAASHSPRSGWIEIRRFWCL